MILNGSLNEESETLYHYTDLDAALAILKNASLRFTDIKYCNDPEEIENGLNIFNKISEEVFDFYKNQSPPFTYLMSFIRHTLNLSTSFKEREENLLQKAQVELKKFGIDPKFSYKKSSIFVCCLSERGDDLRQWLPYASDGRGIALGFKGFNKSHNIVDDGITWAIKVCYKSAQEKEEYARNVYDRAFKVFNSINEKLVSAFVEQVYRGILFDIIACKSGNYKDEEEWRLIYVDFTDNILEKINFKIRDNIIRPFIELSLVKESILEIKLGPKTESNLNTHALNSLLKKVGYSNAQITKTKIAYR